MHKQKHGMWVKMVNAQHRLMDMSQIAMAFNGFQRPGGSIISSSDDATWNINVAFFYCCFNYCNNTSLLYVVISFGLMSFCNVAELVFNRSKYGQMSNEWVNLG